MKEEAGYECIYEVGENQGAFSKGVVGVRDTPSQATALI